MPTQYLWLYLQCQKKTYNIEIEHILCPLDCYCVKYRLFAIPLVAALLSVL